MRKISPYKMEETDFNTKAKDWDAEPMRAERARAVGKGIQRQIHLSTDIEALEYGCGTGLLSFELQPYLGSITLADSAPGMLEVLKDKITRAGVKNMQPRQLDLVVDPLPPDRYHLIYSLMTMHHIPETAFVLQAFYDLLLPGGFIAIADLDQEDGSFHEPSFLGHRGFDRKTLKSLLEKLGFQSVGFTTAYTIHKTIAGKIQPFTVFLATAEKP